LLQRLNTTWPSTPWPSPHSGLGLSAAARVRSFEIRPGRHSAGSGSAPKAANGKMKLDTRIYGKDIPGQRLRRCEIGRDESEARSLEPRHPGPSSGGEPLRRSLPLDGGAEPAVQRDAPFQDTPPAGDEMSASRSDPKAWDSSRDPPQPPGHRRDTGRI